RLAAKWSTWASRRPLPSSSTPRRAARAGDSPSRPHTIRPSTTRSKCLTRPGSFSTITNAASYSTYTIRAHFSKHPTQKCSPISAGCEVVDVGIAPTPTIQLYTASSGARGGLAVTASHNPPEYNALKMFNTAGLFFNHYERGELLDIYHQSAFFEASNAEMQSDLGWLRSGRRGHRADPYHPALHRVERRARGTRRHGLTQSARVQRAQNV